MTVPRGARQWCGLRLLPAENGELPIASIAAGEPPSACEEAVSYDTSR